MGNFKQKNRFNESQRMHKAVCGACGKDCEVPFKPTGDKPVFCNDCFRNKRSGQPRRFGERDSGRFNSSEKRMHKAICDKCGKECEVPFRPTGDKPVYCSECFNKGGKSESSNQAGRQFEIINTKLDKILKALSPTVSSEVDGKKETIKKIKASKPKKINKSNKKKKVASLKKAKPKLKKKK